MPEYLISVVHGSTVPDKERKQWQVTWCTGQEERKRHTQLLFTRSW